MDNIFNFEGVIHLSLTKIVVCENQIYNNRTGNILVFPLNLNLNKIKFMKLL